MFSTQAVIARGTRISKPVMKYLRIVFLECGAYSDLAGAAPAGAADAATGASDLAPVPLDTPVAGALPPRKSVTYQPVPLSWKPAAVSCFLKVDLPQDGQSV